MLKKFPLVMFVFLPIIIAVGCSSQQTTVSDAVTQTATEKQLTTESVIKAFKDAGIPIGSVITYDANTDPNHLLGRPGQYIAKAKWADQRIKQSTYQDASLKGGGVEIFDSQESLNKRWDYLGGFQESALLGFYMYRKDNAIVRLELNLTPEQSAEYENALKNATDSSENLPAGTIKTNTQSNTSTTAAKVVNINLICPLFSKIRCPLFSSLCCSACS